MATATATAILMKMMAALKFAIFILHKNGESSGEISGEIQIHHLNDLRTYNMVTLAQPLALSLSFYDNLPAQFV